MPEALGNDVISTAVVDFTADTRTPASAADSSSAPVPRVLILTAPIGEGHDVPARFLAAQLSERRPAAHVVVADGLQAMGRTVERVVLGGAPTDSVWRDRVFDGIHALMTRVPVVPRLCGRLGEALGGRGLLELIARERPDVVVSTYPGVTEVLGRLRRRGRLTTPTVSAITDLAALRFWAHPGIDLHLVTHPESAPEVRSIAGACARIVPVRGLHDPAYAKPRSRDDGRRALGLALGPRLVVVSGGGWGVGDLAGAVEESLLVEDTIVVVLCGRNDRLLEGLTVRFAGNARVRPMGFTTQVPDLFAGADALVHSTAGLTVLEA
ncbi:MAG: MGDG synthase family glycosyltransferase, partial [Solirubrobacteraceae bacterium]